MHCCISVLGYTAQLLISVYDGTPGGTAATVRLAEELGITVLPLWM